MSNDLGNFPEENNKAIDRYEDMLRQNQEYFFDEEEFLDIIDYYIDKNSSIKAMKAIQLASRQYPYSTVFLIRQAQLYTSIAKFSEALMLLRKVELLEPSNPDVFLIKGSIYIKQNKSQQARECFDKAVGYCYNHDDMDDVLLSIGFEYENAGRFDDAIIYLKKALEKNPKNEIAFFELAFCFELSDREDESIAFFENYIDQFPYNYNAWFNLGIAYNKKELYEKAIEAYDYAILINEQFGSAYFNKANSLAQLERYHEAISVYHETMKYERPDAIAYYYIGECYEKMEEYDKAMTHYNKAIKLDDYLADAWIGMAVVLDYMGRITESIHYAKKAVELDKENADYWYIYAEILQKLGFIDEAKTAYHQVTELDTDIIDVWLDYSNLFFIQEEKERAIEIILSGIKHHPDAVNLQYRAAAYLYKTGKTKDALEYFEMALDRDFKKHELFFEFIPELKNNTEILTLIELRKP